jgi:hypothetical protein
MGGLVKVYFTLDDGRRGALVVPTDKRDGLIATMVAAAAPGGPGAHPSVPVQERSISFAQAMKAAAATATAERVSEDIQRERVETACFNSHWKSGGNCEWLFQTPEGRTYCGRCGCNLSATERGIVPNLAALVEKRNPKTGKIVRGCKHPEREQGKGWKR